MLAKLFEKLKHQLAKTMAGVLYYLLLIPVIVGLVQLGLIPGQWTAWIQRSTDPATTLYLAAAAASGVLWFVSKFSAIGAAKIEFKGALGFMNVVSAVLKDYVIGVYKALEIVIAVVSVACGLYAWLANPFCPTLSATFNVVTSSGEQKVSSGNALFIAAGDNFTITAQPPLNGQAFSCEWEASGGAVEFIRTPHDCTTGVSSFASTSGASMLAVRVRNVCNRAAVFPIKIFTNAPGN